jgi:uncharacterized protein (TIGR00645 family)
MEKQYLEKIGKALYAVRGVMSLYYIGLVFVMFLMLYTFGKEVVKLTVLILSEGVEKRAIIIKSLELVDVVMVAQLVWVVALAGFSLFVTAKHFDTGELEKPDWLTKVNTYNLKLKLAFAVVSISGVHALKTYLEDGVQTERLIVSVVVHLLFVISAVGIAYAEHMTHKKS